MNTDKTPVWRHQVTLVDRNELTIDGATSLGSYDEKEISMDTESGMLNVRGEGMTVKELNLEEGKIVVEGKIKSIGYEENNKERRGLLNRLLK
ncbi:YabP/YqfC family sporulation protein [Anaerosinus sp.]|mgnify:FL=1|uniref:YabP/YqfC family sporulation protein n=1 Tax=Selenobaculum sp. TaxID=3074374 RepID=UPI0015A9215C